MNIAFVKGSDDLAYSKTCFCNLFVGLITIAKEFYILLFLHMFTDDYYDDSISMITVDKGTPQFA